MGKQQHAGQADVIVRRMDEAQVSNEVAENYGAEQRKSADGKRNFGAAEFGPPAHRDEYGRDKAQQCRRSCGRARRVAQSLP